MAKIRYKNIDGGWTQISASDIGAASDDLIARGVGKPIITDTQTNIKNDTVLYIDQNDYDGDRTTITKLNTQSLETPISIENGGTGKDNLAAAKELFATTKTEILDWVYPVGSVYISFNNQSPEGFLGGTWEQITDTFLLASGAKYLPGSSGGKGDFTISAAEIPLRSHTHTPGTYTGPNHRHGVGEYKMPSHTHPLYNSMIVYNNNSKGGQLSGTGNYQTNSLSQIHTDASGTKAITGASGYAGTGYLNGGNSGSAGAKAIQGNSSDTSLAATVTHVNMPPYITVYMWKRTQ